MGSCGSSNNSNSNIYSVPISGPRQGETEVRRNHKFESLIETPECGTTNIQEMIKKSVQKFGDRPYLGTQVNNVYQFITYKETYQKAQQLGSAMLDLNMVPQLNEYKNLTMRMVGVFAKNRPEWIVMDWASCLYQITVVPLYDTLGHESIPFILQQTNLSTIFIATTSLKNLLLLKKGQTGKLSTLILLDPVDDADLIKIKDLGLQCMKYEELLEKGKNKIHDFAPVSKDDIYTFSYTSGTTGNPKGVMLAHRNFISTIASARYTDMSFTETDVHLSYLPLPHVMERLSYLLITFYGGSIGFYRGDPLLLKEDMARLRPTFFVSVPRLYNKFVDAIKSKIEAVTGFKRTFANRAIRIKLDNYHSKTQYNHVLYDKAFAAVRELFGGRVRFMITGSAPISKEVKDFMVIALGVPMLEGYGQTESTGGSFLTADWDNDAGQVGGPLTNTEFKLVDVPEMNYTSLDRGGNGDPQPRGEICIRGPGIFLGYYKDEEKTNETIDEEGWLHTGDVGLILPNGSLRIIDRKKNIFKLSQGEYIAPEKVENVYLSVKGVAEAFIYGDSLQDSCVGILVPDKFYVEEYAKNNAITGSFEDLCKNPLIRKHFLSTVTAEGKVQKLNSLEQAKAIHLEPVSFQLQGLFTTTMKLQRHQAKLRFHAEITALYKELQDQLLQKQK